MERIVDPVTLCKNLFENKVCVGILETNANVFTKERVDEHFEFPQNLPGRFISLKQNDLYDSCLFLRKAMEGMELQAKNEVNEAKMYLEDAAEKALHAFHNPTSSTVDRIFAVKLYVVARILGCLEKRETVMILECRERLQMAFISCLFLLKTLHGLPVVREIFSMYVEGGFWSMLNTSRREENVKSVMITNHILYQFAEHLNLYSSEDWPTIQLSNRAFHPIENWDWQGLAQGMAWSKQLMRVTPTIRWKKRTRLCDEG